MKTYSSSAKPISFASIFKKRSFAVAFSLVSLCIGQGAYAQADYEYDDLGRLERVTYTNTGAIKTFQYDAMGNRTQVSLTQGSSSLRSGGQFGAFGGPPASAETPRRKGPNKPPRARSDFLKGLLEVELSVDVLANDKDPDGDQLLITDVRAGSGILVDITDEGDAIIVEAFAPGLYTIIYTVTDSYGATGSSSLTYVVEE